MNVLCESGQRESVCVWGGGGDFETSDKKNNQSRASNFVFRDIHVAKSNNASTAVLIQRICHLFRSDKNFHKSTKVEEKAPRKKEILARLLECHLNPSVVNSTETKRMKNTVQ